MNTIKIYILLLAVTLGCTTQKPVVEPCKHYFVPKAYLVKEEVDMDMWWWPCICIYCHKQEKCG